MPTQFPMLQAGDWLRSGTDQFDPNWNRAWNQPFSAPVHPSGINATAPSTTGSTPALDPIIQGLLTPVLVPDIARQSAEVAAGRGIAGSPAADSTAVRMSEQNWLQRLALANSLLSGEASRELPYQITPYQRLALQTQKEIANKSRVGTPSFGGGGGGGGSIYPFANMNFGGTETSRAGGGTLGSRDQWTLEDAYDWLGFGNFGEVLGDSSSGFPEFGGAGFGDTTPDFGSLTPGMPDLDWDF